MKQFTFTKNPFLLFSPFLVFYLILVFYFPTNGKYGDEIHYLMYANNLIHGFYSPPAPDIHIVSGPGYPIILMPFVALKLPLISMTILNAFFYYFSIILLYKSLSLFVSVRNALLASLFWAFYINVYAQLVLIYTEIFTAFLITLCVYLMIKLYCSKLPVFRNKYIYLAGFSLGFLALTKVIFGYVLLSLMVAFVFCYIRFKYMKVYKEGIMVIAFAFLTTAPYLIYTYNLTGKIFYWATSGGNNFYWLTSPHPREYGDWYGIHDLKPSIDKNKFDPSALPGRNDSILSNHYNDHKKIFQYMGVERDSVYKSIAIANIKSDPSKFIKNCVSNLGRLLFNFPNSYTLQRPINLLRLPFTGVISVFLLIAMLPTILNWKNIHFAIRFVICFSIIYIGGSILGSAETRMFTIIVPNLLMWIAYIFERTITFNPKFANINQKMS